MRACGGAVAGVKEAVVAGSKGARVRRVVCVLGGGREGNGRRVWFG